MNLLWGLSSYKLPVTIRELASGRHIPKIQRNHIKATVQHYTMVEGDDTAIYQPEALPQVIVLQQYAGRPISRDRTVH